MSQEIKGLYLISPPVFELETFAEKLEQALSAAYVPVFQLRIKSADENGKFIAPPKQQDVIEAVEMLLPICHEYNTHFILNDNPQLAKSLGCSGVHLGEDDMSVAEARKLLGDNFLIGASCYGSKDRAFLAAEQGADYVAFGAFYETQTKDPKGHPSPDILKFWTSYTNLPCVAIGGIKTDNAKILVDSGADFIAVVTGVWDYEGGVAEAVKKFTALYN